MKKLVALLLAVVVMLCCSGCSIIDLVFGNDDEAYIQAAKDVVEKEFSRISVIRFGEEEIYDEDDCGRAIVRLEVRFGALDQKDVYVCITSIDEEGYYTYSKYFSYTMDKSEISELKEYNDWGEPQ